MNSSAIRSSSAVVIPGCTCSPSSAIVSATSSPARAMPSISWALFLMINAVPPLRVSRRGHLLQRGLDLGEDLVLAARPVNRHEAAAYPVVLDQRLGLAVVVLESALDRIVRIVGAPLELRALAQPLESDRVGDLQRE